MNSNKIGIVIAKYIITIVVVYLISSFFYAYYVINNLSFTVYMVTDLIRFGAVLFITFRMRKVNKRLVVSNQKRFVLLGMIIIVALLHLLHVPQEFSHLIAASFGIHEVSKQFMVISILYEELFQGYLFLIITIGVLFILKKESTEKIKLEKV